jgi:enoyl-CoA hydratase/carnithine racemase
VTQDTSVRVVLLGANGPSFAVGGDINMFHGLAGPALPNSLRDRTLCEQLSAERDSVVRTAATEDAAAGIAAFTERRRPNIKGDSR